MGARVKFLVITGNYRGVSRAITKLPLRPRRGPASGPEGRGLRGVRRGSVVPDGRRPRRLGGRSGSGRGLRGPESTLARAKDGPRREEDLGHQNEVLEFHSGILQVLCVISVKYIMMVITIRHLRWSPECRWVFPRVSRPGRPGASRLQSPILLRGSSVSLWQSLARPKVELASYIAFERHWGMDSRKGSPQGQLARLWDPFIFPKLPVITAVMVNYRNLR